MPSELAPHCPLVDITLVGDGTGLVVLVEVMNEEGLKLNEVDVGLEDELALLQLPKASLQPASQYIPVLPHHPYSLQQLPNADPEHVNPWVPPQLPSVETFASVGDGGNGVGAEKDVVEEETEVTWTGGDVMVDKVEVDSVNGVELFEIDVIDTKIAVVEELDEPIDVEEGIAGPKDDFPGGETVDLQSPKPVWQPVPQYAGDEPQYPPLEQQFPNTEFLQLRPLLDWIPQRTLKLDLSASAPRNGRAVMARSTAECIVNVKKENE